MQIRAAKLYNLDLHPRCNGLVKTLSDEAQCDITSMSEKLAILSFFEDSNIYVRTEDGLELPLWCGSLSFDCRNFSSPQVAPDIKRASILATTPSASWNPRQLHEWRKFSKPLSSLRSIPRRAIPLPPLARLQGVTAKDAAILREVAECLNGQDEVICLGAQPFNRLNDSYIPMSVVIMSQKQALQRIQSGLGALHCRLKNMWSLDYFTSKTGQITKTQDELSMPEEDGLFAFMDGPYEDLEYFGNTLDISSLAQDIIAIMSMHWKFSKTQCFEKISRVNHLDKSKQE